MDHLVGLVRDDVLFDEHLDAIRDRLEDPEGADTVRTEAVLDPGQNLPLDQRNQGKKCQKHSQNPRNVHHDRSQINHPLGGTSEEAQKPLL